VHLIDLDEVTYTNDATREEASIEQSLEYAVSKRGYADLTSDFHEPEKPATH
jgi:hypothetical protein